MHKNDEIVLVSGGFDPLHSGHLSMMRQASSLGNVIVILNTNQFLLNKKGYFFMDIMERKTILESLKYVKEVFISIDKDQTVSKSIEKLALSKKYNIKYFLNGGDRNSFKDIPESSICSEYNIQLCFDSSGEKENSSSDLINNIVNTISIGNDSHNMVIKPWGYYKTFFSNSNSCLKKLVINPNEEISYQFHNKRFEHWILMEGQIQVKINGKVKKVNPGEHIYIEKKYKHSIINDGAQNAVLAEVQYGESIDENDIVRIKDKYNRK